MILDGKVGTVIGGRFLRVTDGGLRRPAFLLSLGTIKLVGKIGDIAERNLVFDHVLFGGNLVHE